MTRRSVVVDERQYRAFVEAAQKTDVNGRLERYPDLRPAKMQNFPHLDSAVANHEMWHQKKVEAVYQQNVPFPLKMACAGHAIEIVYLSDKWEEHADFYSYVHHFDTGPEVFVDAAMVEGGDVVATARLLGVKSVGASDKLATPILGRVAEFTFRLHDGNPHALVFGFPPLMVCAPDREGLVILSTDLGPIVVRGGQMEITERGIVR
jgi:hypothetical protein